MDEERKRCTKDGCNLIVSGRGYFCTKHYKLKASTKRTTCPTCKVEFTVTTSREVYCSVNCSTKSKWSAFRIALVNNDYDAFMVEVKKQTVCDRDCWLWTGNISSRGYPDLTIYRGKNTTQRFPSGVHRNLVALRDGGIEAKKQVHHTCANKLCLKPDHLIAVEPHENSAEMLERNWYINRISQLEAELKEAKGI